MNTLFIIRIVLTFQFATTFQKFPENIPRAYWKFSSANNQLSDALYIQKSKKTSKSTNVLVRKLSYKFYSLYAKNQWWRLSFEHYEKTAKPRREKLLLYAKIGQLEKE